MLLTPLCSAAHNRSSPIAFTLQPQGNLSTNPIVLLIIRGAETPWQACSDGLTQGLWHRARSRAGGQRTPSPLIGLTFLCWLLPVSPPLAPFPPRSPSGLLYAGVHLLGDEEPRKVCGVASGHLCIGRGRDPWSWAPQHRPPHVFGDSVWKGPEECPL